MRTGRKRGVRDASPVWNAKLARPCWTFQAITGENSSERERRACPRPRRPEQRRPRGSSEEREQDLREEQRARVLSEEGPAGGGARRRGATAAAPRRARAP